MDDKQKKHGAISWSELMTSDVSGAKTFYSQLFGWTYEDMPSNQMPYTVVKANDEQVAGIMTLPEQGPPMPPCWGTYITVDDVEKTAEQATGLGGKILVQPTEIPDVGRFCVLQDPQGAFINLITYTK